MTTNVKNENTNYGIGFVGLLTILFIGLKLTGTITWSWFWVLSPLWISALFWIIALIIIFIWALTQLKN
jgi:uncharacterized protein (DUF983 family)